MILQKKKSNSYQALFKSINYNTNPVACSQAHLPPPRLVLELDSHFNHKFPLFFTTEGQRAIWWTLSIPQAAPCFKPILWEPTLWMEDNEMLPGTAPVQESAAEVRLPSAGRLMNQSCLQTLLPYVP